MNPFGRLRHFLANAGLPANAAFFVPCFGIGDRLRFFSYLHLFDIFNACRSYVVVEKDAPQDLLAFFPDLLKERVVTAPADLIVKPLDPHLYAMGDDRPGAQRIYFTWHKQYQGGHNAAWEQINHENITHDLMVKQILGVPAVFAPNRIHRLQEAGDREPVVYIAPYSVSNPGLPQDFWLSLGDVLTGQGLRVVCNAKTVAGNVYEHQQYGELHRRFPTVECSLAELVARVGKARGIVTVRSGLSDLFSLTDLPSITLTHNRIGSFWKLPNHFGRHLEINVDRQPLPEAVAQVASFLAA